MKTHLSAMFFASIWFAIGTALMLINNEMWNALGAILWVIAIVIIIIATWDTMWERFESKTREMQYLFESAKGLDRERLAALLHALGLKSLPVQEFKTNLSINLKDHNDTITTTRNVFNIPVSPEQLRILADGLINEGAPFSRREWVDRRHTLTDAQYRNLQAAFETEKIIELRSTDNPNAGFKLSKYGEAIMREQLPSPAPHMEEVQNQA